MKIAGVKKLSPFERLVYWIRERESIRLKKEAGEPKPWTEDEILQSYRFCNVRRMDDKVSQWLMTNWYEPYKDHPNILTAVALARFVNKPESLNVVTQSVFSFPKPKWDKIKTGLRIIKSSGETVFNGAYMVRGNSTKSPDKIGTVVDEYVRPMIERVMIANHSMEQTWEQIKDSYGFGSFMAGQVVADLRWAVSGPWNDRNEWAPIGPGSLRGMNRLQGRELKTPISQEDFLIELRAMVLNLKSGVPSSIRNRLELMDYQNCLCEYDKYNRALNGEGRPKSRYAGGS